MKYVKLILIFLCIKLVIAQNFTSSSDAFGSTIVQLNPTTIAVQFNVASGYDLYQDKIKIISTKNSAVILGKMQLPRATPKQNQILGNYFVYSDAFEVLLPITKFGDGNLSIEVKYQGCKADSFCYPEVVYNKTLRLTQDVTLISKPTNYYNNKISSINDFGSTSTSSVKIQPKITTDMKNAEVSDSNFMSILNSSNIGDIAKIFTGSYFLIIIGFFLVGVLISFTPCVFPMLPILLSIVVGQGLNVRRTTILSISYILGSAVSYAIAGAIAAIFGNSVQSFLQNIWVNSIIAFMFVVFSLSLFGLFELQLPNVIRKYFTRELGKKHSIYGVFLTGAISTLILSPCVTAPLAGALLYISSSGNIILGGSALFVMGIGSGLPLLLIAVFGNKLLPKNGAWMIHVKHILGFIMLAMGVYLSSRFISHFWTYMLASVWLVSFGVFVFKLQKRNDKLFFISSIIAIIIGISGLALFGKSTINALYASSNMVKMKIINVKNIAELNLVLQNAKQRKLPVMIDYTASWCVICQEMKLSTFVNAEVINLINSKFVNINIDISSNDPTTRELMDKYQVFAPPTFIFINVDGSFDEKGTIVGYISDKKLISILEKY